MKRFEKEVFDYIKDMFVQHHMVKRTILALVSIIIMGIGISLFSVSGFGVDPFTSMNMNISSALGIRFGTLQMMVNFTLLLYTIIIAHRGLVGFGTVFNMVGVGYICEYFSKLFTPVLKNYYHIMPVRIGVLLFGIVVLCFACSLFFTSNVGVGPYDSIGFMFSRRANIPYKWVRVITDIVVIIIGLVVSGGLVQIFNGDFSQIRNIGIGTIVSALCMGPLVNFFNKTVSSKIMNVDYEKISKEVAFFIIKGAMVKNAPVKVDSRHISAEGQIYAA